MRQIVVFSLNFVGLRLATPAGLEPATCRLEGGCSIQLSYGAKPTISPLVNATKARRGRGESCRNRIRSCAGEA